MMPVLPIVINNVSMEVRKKRDLKFYISNLHIDEESGSTAAVKKVSRRLQNVLKCSFFQGEYLVFLVPGRSSYGLRCMYDIVQKWRPAGSESS